LTNTAVLTSQVSRFHQFRAIKRANTASLLYALYCVIYYYEIITGPI